MDAGLRFGREERIAWRGVLKLLPRHPTPAGRASGGPRPLVDATVGMLGLAALVGVGAGLGAVAFRELVFAGGRAFAGHSDPSAFAVRHWWLIVVPVIGGLIYGPLVARWAPEARGHGVPEVMLAVRRHGGRIRLRVPFVKALASAICIGSGGSVGREGPIAQIGAALGSGAGQWLKIPEARLRLIVACGAAGGIAATFNAPLGGAFFALEVVLAEFSAEAFGLVVVSAVVADAVGRAVFGSAPFLHLPAVGLDSAAQLPLYALLGLVAAPVAVGFTRLLYGAEDAADRLWRGPESLRPAIGGIALGLLLFAVPQVYGVGYPVLTRAVQGHDAVALLLALLLAKAIATSLTMAIGGSGGVFAPSLFLGAMLGSALGQGAHALVPGLVAHPGAFGLVGMAAVFAAAARAPIAAALVVFELTGDYPIMLPLLLAVVVAVALASRLSGDTIYTLKLRRRGIAIDRPSPWLERLRVADAMRLAPAALPASASIDEAAAALAHEEAIPVAGRDALRVAAPEDVEQAVGDASTVTIGDVAQPVEPLAANASLAEAARRLSEGEHTALPVVDADGDVVGWLGHQEVLAAVARQGRAVG